MCYKINDFFDYGRSNLVTLRMRFDWEGVGIYCSIVSMLERQPDVTLDCNYLMLSFHFNVEEETIRAIVEDFNLFELEETGGTRRFFLAPMREEALRQARISAKRAAAAEKRWQAQREAAENRERDRTPQGPQGATEREEILKAQEEPETQSLHKAQSARRTSLSQPAMINPGLTYDLLRHPETFTENKEWLARAAKDHKCSMPVLMKLFQLFMSHVAATKNEPYHTLRDAQIHFYHWLGKSYAKDRKQFLIREEEREHRERERKERERERADHDSKAITYAEYLRRKGLTAGSDGQRPGGITAQLESGQAGR